MRNAIKISIVLIVLIVLSLLIKIFLFNPRVIQFEEANLHDKVKSIEEISYKAKLQGKQVVKLKRWRYAHLKDDFLVHFNEDGNIMKMTVWPAADTGTVKIDLLYRYYEKDKLMSIQYGEDIPIGPEYFYNSKGQLIKKVGTLNHIRYEYFPDGKLHQETQVDNEIGDEFITTYTYENDFIKYKDVYYTVANWHLIHEYSRDEHGNIIKHRLGEDFKEIKGVKWETFEYTFDKHNNWTKCIHYKFKKPIYIIERKVVYY